MTSSKKLTPPRAKRRKFFHKKFQDRRSDPYYWLREKDSPEVLEYLKAENAYAKSFFDQLKPLQQELYQEMKSHIPGDYDTCPVKKGPYFYYYTWIQDKEHSIYKRTKELNKKGKEEVLLDINQLAAGRSYCEVNNLWISPRHDILAYALDEEGREFYTIYFKNLRTGQEFPHLISRVTSDFVWANDNQTVFYVKQDPETLRPFQIFRFNLLTGTNDLVFTETDDRFMVSVNKSLSEKYIFILSSSRDTSEWQFLSADKPSEKLTLFCKREEKHEYHLDCGKDCFYILTNREDAFNFKLMKAGLSDHSPALWEEIIPHSEESFITDFQVFEGFIALEVRQKALRDVVILDREKKTTHKVSFPEAVYCSWTQENLEYQTDNVRIYFNSPIHSGTLYDYHVREQRLIFRWQMLVSGGFSSENYVCERIFASARDGTQVPITLVHRKDLHASSSTPLLLDGYGSYGLSCDPCFNSSLLPLLNRGFIFAIAHIRGGSEMGKKWYHNGRLLKKKNTFTDFIDCAEYLRKSHTSSEHLYIMGGSAGGLLMGAVLNERPELFYGAVATVPFVDVLTTMLDDKIPLSTMEYEEWGNPHEKAYYDYIKSYSPYDNVKKTNYPHLFIRTGYYDPRVQYWEPAKWSARLREFKTNQTLLLFLTDMESGHFGPTGRFQRLSKIAQEHAFFIYLEQMRKNKNA